MTIAALACVILGQEIATNPEQFKVPAIVRPAPERVISPSVLATLGGVADAASTYYFSKAGTGREMNPLLAGITSPEGLGLMALGGLVATKGATALIRKASPRVADAIAANLGAQQVMLAAGNFTLEQGGAFDRYKAAMDRYAVKGMR